MPLPLNKAGQLPLRRLLKALGQRDVMRVWCEGGGVLAGALIDQGLADEVWSFVAPVFLGGDKAAFSLKQKALGRVDRWRFLAPELVGEDVLLRAVRKEKG